MRTRTLRLPANSRIPEPLPGSSSPAEYERYFDLERVPTDLAAWTADCLELERTLLPDLRDSDLTDAERNRILTGLLITYRATLERWKRTSEQSASEEMDACLP